MNQLVLLALLCAPPKFNIDWVPEPIEPRPTQAPAPVNQVAQKPSTLRAVIVTSDGCPPCKRMFRKGGPVDQFRAQFRTRRGPRGETIEIQVINASQYPKDAAQYNPTAYPTIICLRDGEEVARQNEALASVEQFNQIMGIPAAWQEVPKAAVVPATAQPVGMTYQELWNHLTRDHGYRPQQLRGASYDRLNQLHNFAHGVR